MEKSTARKNKRPGIFEQFCCKFESAAAVKGINFEFIAKININCDIMVTALDSASQ
jgi:hypothetical protein